MAPRFHRRRYLARPPHVCLHHLGGQSALAGGEYPVTEVLQGQAHLEVLGERLRIVDLARRSRTCDVPERLDREQGRRAGQAQRLALQAPDIPHVADVLVALEHPHETASLPAAERAADATHAGLSQPLFGTLDKPLVDETVGVLHEHRVRGVELWQESSENLV